MSEAEASPMEVEASPQVEDTSASNETSSSVVASNVDGSVDDGIKALIHKIVSEGDLEMLTAKSVRYLVVSLYFVLSLQAVLFSFEFYGHSPYTFYFFFFLAVCT